MRQSLFSELCLLCIQTHLKPLHPFPQVRFYLGPIRKQTLLELIISPKWNCSKQSRGNVRPIRTRNATFPIGTGPVETLRKLNIFQFLVSCMSCNTSMLLFCFKRLQIAFSACCVPPCSWCDEGNLSRLNDWRNVHHMDILVLNSDILHAIEQSPLGKFLLS